MPSQDNTAWKRALYEAIGREVMRRRNAANLTVRVVATKLGVSYQMVQRIEAGDNAPTHYLAAFAQLLKCSIADLVPVVPITFNHVIGEEDT
jgi:transcriptional regulator with XRE-family HTH domain